MYHLRDYDDNQTQPLSMPPALVALVFAGAAAALAGGYWDDAWHTERGRDEFFIAPHIAIYAGIAVAGARSSLWALLVARRAGRSAVWSHRPLARGAPCRRRHPRVGPDRQRVARRVRARRRHLEPAAHARHRRNAGARRAMLAELVGRPSDGHGRWRRRPGR